VRVVEYNSSSSFYEQLLMIKDTGVYISVHTSNLANSPLLQPGSAVVEIIQVGGPAAGC
jgi:protein O-GlcNAc transferase